jgi:hypothetical protein
VFSPISSGWLSRQRRFRGALVSAILRWVLVGVLAVFAGLSLYDFTLIRRGRASEMLLQLPTALKRRIHASIRTRVRTAALAGSSLVLGFLVSIFEFACTGQVYLPHPRVARPPGERPAVGLGPVHAPSSFPCSWCSAQAGPGSARPASPRFFRGTWAR